MHSLALFFPFLLAPIAASQVVQALNITTLAAVDGSSTLECWQLNAPTIASTEPGTVGLMATALGTAGDVTYKVIPAGYDGGLHNAPAVQWVAFLSGLAHIVLPDDPTCDAWVQGGQFGLILAVDTKAVSTRGHVTTYPGTTETTALEIPIAGGAVPAHIVLYGGPCKTPGEVGIRNSSTIMDMNGMMR